MDVLSEIQFSVINNISEDFFVENDYGSETFRREFPKLTLLQDWAFSRMEEWTNRPTAVFVQTPTASGKTLAVSGAIFNRINKHESFTEKGLFLYPFRALNEDQLGQLCRYGNLFGFSGEDFSVFYGGKKIQDLRKAQQDGRFLLATPDKVIHMFGGGRESRAEFTSLVNSYRYIMFDEIHTYSGLMLWATSYLLRFWVGIIKENPNMSPPTLFFVSATLTDEVESFLKSELEKLGYDIVSVPNDYAKSLAGDWKVRIRGTQMHEKEVLNYIQKGSVVISNSAWKAKAIYENCTEEGIIKESEGLLYIGQDKFEESKRKENLKRFKENPEEHVFFTSPAAEAGVDFTTSSLITEETIASSMIQRVGRAGRSSKDSDEKAEVIVYSPLLERKFSDLDGDSIDRENFEETVRNELKEESLFTDAEWLGIVAYPFFEKVEESVLDIDFELEPSHKEIVEKLKDSNVGTFFRSFIPYTRYSSEGEEGISFRALCRRNLELKETNYGLKVIGRPDPDRYYSSRRPDYQRVTVELKNESPWIDRLIEVQGEKIIILFAEFIFRFPQTGGKSVETNEISLIWFAVDRVPPMFSSEFEVEIPGKGSFKGGFVDEDFGGLVNE